MLSGEYSRRYFLIDGAISLLHLRLAVKEMFRFNAGGREDGKLQPGLPVVLHNIGDYRATYGFKTWRDTFGVDREAVDVCCGDVIPLKPVHLTWAVLENPSFRVVPGNKRTKILVQTKRGKDADLYTNFEFLYARLSHFSQKPPRMVAEWKNLDPEFSSFKEDTWITDLNI